MSASIRRQLFIRAHSATSHEFFMQHETLVTVVDDCQKSQAGPRQCAEPPRTCKNVPNWPPAQDDLHIQTETREETESVDQRRDGGGGDVEEEETKVEVQAEEVEMGDGRRWKCQVCGLTFSRQAAILNHFKLRHRVGSVPGESGEEVRHPEVKVEPVAPVKHIVTVEAKAGVGSLPGGATPSVKTWKELGCHLCGQAFKTGKILRTHISVVHSAGRPFPCGFQGCSFAFKTKGSLTRHERRHTGERPFACQHCGRRFRESGSLSRHLQSQGSCVNKSDAQIPLYGRTLPLQTHPAERKVRLL
ncbi:Transcription factor E4F1 [Chionoecetes opilio]|uniref:Transcription factor E4F1 n=1 Tax=Chionoecetes opilio TaxID=41210 RepID=A0A8J4YEK9_CHIOP|nr:Transcription factor E4F1 [Chionoecetes opilio]